jgi:mannose-6-phosphate isomerase-like protein (cupin superfamily)
MRKVNLAERFAAITEAWNPRIAARVNSCLVKLVRFEGEFLWHHHEREDELFLVVRGRVIMRVRDPQEREIVVESGELIVIPAGVEHMPVAMEETHVLLFEPDSTLNTGNVVNERTRARLESI